MVKLTTKNIRDFGEDYEKSTEYQIRTAIKKKREARNRDVQRGLRHILK